jgi:hypothetical protein
LSNHFIFLRFSVVFQVSLSRFQDKLRVLSMSAFLWCFHRCEADVTWNFAPHVTKNI